MLIAFYFSAKQIYHLLVVEGGEWRSVGQMSGTDSLCLQKPCCLSSRDKVEHIYQEKLHIEEPGASVT